jgi:O-antigen/teichoic acid export membrane protein
VLIGDVQLGWYSPAYKLTFVFQCIPAAFGAALYPAMSRLFLNEKERLVGIFEKSLHFLMVIAVPISIGIGVLAHSIVTLVYTSTFEPSVISLQILIGAVIVIFMGFPVGALLNACDKQMVNTVNMGISMVVNIILNVILIPRYQHVGASIAALSTLTLLLILNFSWVSKVIRFRFGFFFKRASITLFSGAVMGAVVYWVKDDINIVFSVALGAIVYVGMMYALRGFTKSDIQFFIQAVIKRT